MTQKLGKEGEQDETRTLSNPDHRSSQHRVVDTRKVRSVLKGQSCPHQVGDPTVSFQQHQTELGRLQHCCV